MHSLPTDKPLAFTGFRVLVADDNAINCRIAVRMLEKLGCHADAAASGQQVLSMHALQPYDLILMDCHMPDIDGYQASLHIRRSEAQGKRTPIIGWTAATQPEDRERCLAAGMDDLMGKSLQPQVLQQLLSCWLQPAPALASAAAADSDDMAMEAMREMIGSNFSELAELYQADMSQRIEALQTASGQGDAKNMARIAHIMSGSCVSIGAARLGSLCQEVEIMARAGAIDAIAPRLEMIISEYARVQSKLQGLSGKSVSV